MSNPTIGYESQFNGPFDILPNIIYTNPTTGQSQFTQPLSYPNGNQTFDYNFPGETTNFISKNPTWDPAGGVKYQFLTFPIDNSTGVNTYTFNYTYPNEIINFIPENPTKPDNVLEKPTNVTTDSIKKQFEKATDQAPWTPIITTITPGATPVTLQNSSNLNGGALLSKAVGFAGSAVGSQFGIPQVSQVTDSILGQIGPVKTSIYSTLNFDQLKPLPGVKYADFRSRKVLGNGVLGIAQSRLDGTSAAFRGGRALYAAASANPLGGAYAVFNLDGMGTSGFGWGDHDNPSAIRNDFTMRSHVATRWAEGFTIKRNNSIIKGQWSKTSNPVEFVTAFRGDRVNVIDFGNRSLKYAYQWNPDDTKILGAQGNITQDFIKFYLTGPRLRNGVVDPTVTDDIIVFRALISSLSDTFSPAWSPQTMIGRADPNYHYTGVTRDLNLDFTVYATDRDEVKPIWRKLNALAGYTAPEYDKNTIALKAPWMRITIGDLFHQQPVIITSLAYTLHDSDSTWEINIENDPTMMQVPHKITVSLALTLITDSLPQNGGRFYSLAKDYDLSGSAKPGNNNWLSDATPDPTNLELDTKYLPAITSTSAPSVTEQR